MLLTKTNEKMTALTIFINKWYRNFRYLFYFIIEPFDYLYRYFLGYSYYPPIRLRRHVGTGGFDWTGIELVAYLKLLCNLKPNDIIWDIGCGYGNLQLSLANRGWFGTIIGTDIHKPCISWAQKNISSKHQSFKFIHADIYNYAYWTKGKNDAESWLSNYIDNKNFDIIVARSLFTHMLPDELDIYFKYISKSLKNSGKVVATFFLLNDKQKNIKINNSIHFIRKNESLFYSIKNKLAPTAAVAYDEDYIIETMGKYSLIVEKIYYGTWSGREDCYLGQDLIVMKKII